MAVSGAQGFPESSVFDRAQAWPGFFGRALPRRNLNAAGKSWARLRSVSRTIDDSQKRNKVPGLEDSLQDLRLHSMEHVAQLTNVSWP
jgi:hypothetical protein